MIAALFQGPVATWGLVDILVFVVVLAACVALVLVALRQFGIAIPAWVAQCLWIVVVAFFVILCIRFVAGM